MSLLSREALEEWYDSMLPLHRRLTSLAKHTIEQILLESGIPHLAVQSRVKSRESFLQKAQDGDYSDPIKQIHDICAIRVITYVRADRDRLATRLRTASLQIVNERAHDKPMGYRAFHLVCTFGQQRCSLPEFAPFSGLHFELQLHTALEHAWAQITHDRQYKFASGLPDHLDQRFNQLAANLATSDAEFTELVKQIDEYEKQISEDQESGRERPIDPKSLPLFLDDILGAAGYQRPRMNDRQIISRLIQEMQAFGIDSRESLRGLLSQAVLESLYRGRRSRFSTVAGQLRTAMLLTDPE